MTVTGIAPFPVICSLRTGIGADLRTRDRDRFGESVSRPKRPLVGSKNGRHWQRGDARFALRSTQRSCVDRRPNVNQLALIVQVLNPERKNFPYPHSRRTQHKTDCPKRLIGGRNNPCHFVCREVPRFYFHLSRQGQVRKCDLGDFVASLAGRTQNRGERQQNVFYRLCRSLSRRESCGEGLHFLTVKSVSGHSPRSGKMCLLK